MPNQTIPITLTASTVPTSVTAANMNELIALVAQYLQGSIRTDVTFILTVAVDPTSLDSVLIFNSTQGVFKYWSTSLGRYVAVTDNIIGDIKYSFDGGDQVAQGWVVLNGRTITAIPGLVQSQIDVLDTFFPGGTLPVVTPVNGADLPAEASFSGISGVEIAPADGVIGALAVSNPPTQAEVEALRDNTEILRDSTEDLAEATMAMKAVSETMLEALRANTTPPMVAYIFCGFP